MSWDEGRFEDQLKQAVEAYDRQAATALCQELIAHLRHRADVYPEGAARRVLQLLRNKRFFDLLQRAADAFIQSGQRAPRVRRLYAQALLDQSSLTAAIAELKSLAADTENTDPAEQAEACALIGRACKQLYVDASDPSLARNRENLERAVEAYYNVYLSDPQKHTWPCINVVALLNRAARDQVPLAGFPQPREQAAVMASELLSAIETQYDALDDERDADTWSLGTATEACVALNKPDEALKWCGRYVRSRYADAFELASTLRQFSEVWQLAPTDPIRVLLQAELLRREGGFVELTPEQIRQQQQSLSGTKAAYEKVFGADSFVSLDWYRRGLERGLGVARIGLETARGEGTGFLISGRDFLEAWGDELILLTNAHVLSPDPQVKGALRPDAAVVLFEALSNGGQQVSCRIEEILWTSPPEQFDATFARLSVKIEGATKCELAKARPLREDNQRVYVIGYPGGGALSFSLHDNLLLDYDDRLIHYRTPTEGGSSGSPVFNQQWQLIGLHHLGGVLPKLNGQTGTYEANEGIWIQAIRRAVNSNFSVAGSTV
ncbi:MAG TPA: serine protease [Blastocatellia bacterium]|nr:serine protease [Blastocatellia bacterium]